jgi:ATP-dependent RNA helicase DHX57
LAETSITIDDCVFVVDSGRMKEKAFDPVRNMESLDTVWVSRANALQRKGRAGRVMPGVCFSLFTSFRFEHHMRKDPVPEVLRVPLEAMILRIKTMLNFKVRSSILIRILELIMFFSGLVIVGRAVVADRAPGVDVGVLGRGPPARGGRPRPRG